jgi:hypothetical protein
MHDVTTSGVLTTATDPVRGGREGAISGAERAQRHAALEGERWRRDRRRTMTYQVDGSVTPAAGHSLFTFALR